jgi:hypothetical protein
MKNIMGQFSEGVKMSGEWDFLLSSPETQAEMQNVLKASGRAAYRAFVEAGVASGLIRKTHYKNIIPTVSRSQMALALCGQITTKTEIQISHSELGTGTTTPANGDTGLQTPTGATRKAISSMDASGAVANFTSYWAATEATGTWREFALFINGSGTSNSGVLFNHVAINITVSSSDALTIDGTVTLS